MSVCVCVSLSHTYGYLARPGESLDPLEFDLEVPVSYLTWVPGTKSGSPEEQQMVLSPEPCLQPVCFLARFCTMLHLKLYHSAIREIKPSLSLSQQVLITKPLPSTQRVKGSLD